MFCQIYKCYAYEIGCCDPEFFQSPHGFYPMNLPCICMDEAWHPPERPDDSEDVSHLRFRPWVDRYGRRPYFWNRETESYRPVDVADRMRACVHCHEGCGLPGTYAVAFCPFRFDESDQPRDRRFVCSDDGMATWSRADGEDWDAPGNPYIERLKRVKAEFKQVF